MQDICDNHNVSIRFTEEGVTSPVDNRESESKLLEKQDLPSITENMQGNASKSHHISPRHRLEIKSDIDRQKNANSSDSDSDQEDLYKHKLRYEKQPVEELYKRLLEVDPVSAKRLHPRNRRKIARYNVYTEQYTGKLKL